MLVCREQKPDFKGGSSAFDLGVPMFAQLAHHQTASCARTGGASAENLHQSVTQQLEI